MRFLKTHFLLKLANSVFLGSPMAQQYFSRVLKSDSFLGTPIFIIGSWDLYESSYLLAFEIFCIRDLYIYVNLAAIILFAITSFILLVALTTFKYFYYPSYLQIKTFFWIPYYYFSLWRDKHYYEIIMFSYCFSAFLLIVRHSNLSLFLSLFIINISIELEISAILLAESSSGRLPRSYSGPAYGEAGPSNYNSNFGSGGNDDGDGNDDEKKNRKGKSTEVVDLTSEPLLSDDEKRSTTKYVEPEKLFYYTGKDKCTDDIYFTKRSEALDHDRLKKIAFEKGYTDANNRVITRNEHHYEDLVKYKDWGFFYVFRDEYQVKNKDPLHRKRLFNARRLLNDDDYVELKQLYLEKYGSRYIGKFNSVFLDIHEFARNKDRLLKEEQIKQDKANLELAEKLVREEQINKELGKLKQAKSGHASNKPSISNLINLPKD